MKRLGIILFIFLFFFSGSIIWAKDSGIRFSDFDGEVQVRPDSDEDAWDTAEIDMVLNVDDHIKTGDDSTAVLSLTDMTTFVMKPDSEIILATPPEKENKIKLIAGKVWVNVKRMVKDGTMDVEMSQAVAGIKGTNITCSSNLDGSENRVKVLRGHARVLILETQQEMDVQMGEELIIKKGGKSEKQEINVQQEQKKWHDATSKLGESIDVGEIPETIKKMIENETNGFAKIQENFQNLIGLTDVDSSSVAEIKKTAERFLGVIMEDNFILASMKKKVANALGTKGISNNDRMKLLSYQKLISGAVTKIQGISKQIGKIMRYQFKHKKMYPDITADVESVQNDINSALTDINGIKSEISASPSGKSQDWFKDSADVAVDTLNKLNNYSQQIQDLIDKNPEDKTAQALLKHINDQISSINSLLKDLQVVEIDSGTMTEMQQIDDVVGTQIVALQDEISNYNSTVQDSSEGTARLKSSLNILKNFVNVRRQYQDAQRMYDSVMKSTQNSKFKTSEQEEFEQLWQDISDRFQQLGIAADELKSNVDSLEEQLSHFVN